MYKNGGLFYEGSQIQIPPARQEWRDSRGSSFRVLFLRVRPHSGTSHLSFLEAGTMWQEAIHSS